MVKTPGSQKLPMQNDNWNGEEDEGVIAYVSKHGKGLRKSGKTSKQKWNAEKKPDPRHKSFTPQEEELVIKLHAAIGSRWNIIAQQLPGRTDNDVKILWNSKLRKKLSAMGIDPVTHRPFSQIIADYGNMGAFPKARTRYSSLSRDLKNAVFLPAEQSQRNAQAFLNPNMNFSAGNTSNFHVPEHNPLDLYSQFQSINLVTEASSYSTNTESMTSYFTTSSDSTSLAIKQEISSFSWSDFLLEDAFVTAGVDEQSDAGMFLQCEETNKGKLMYDEAVEDVNSNIKLLNCAEASSSSNSSFVESMMERHDDMFPEFPELYEEPFYY